MFTRKNQAKYVRYRQGGPHLPPLDVQVCRRDPKSGLSMFNKDRSNTILWRQQIVRISVLRERRGAPAAFEQTASG